MLLANEWKPAEVHETYSRVEPGPAICLFLDCPRGRCELEVTVDFTHHRPAWEKAHVEVLCQRVDAAGIPTADPIVIFETNVALAEVPHGRRTGFVRLPPTLLPEDARRCYFRVSESNEAEL